MSERILKSDQAREGAEYKVSVRPPAARPAKEAQPLDKMDLGSPAAGAKKASKERSIEPEYQLPSDRARSEAERIVDEAEQMAQEIAAEARAEAITLKEQAEGEVSSLRELASSELAVKREKLEAETRSQLEAEYRERYQHAVVSLEQAAKELREKQAQYLADIEQPALKLVVAIAQQLMGIELSNNPETIAVMVARACELLKPEQVATVTVCPAAHTALTEDALLQGALRESGVSPERVELVASEALAPGKFVVRVNGMSIDYDIQQAVAEVIEQLESRAQAQQASME
jgi:flagellar biosynthesis/type III secretory pathway protein FliH